MSKNPLAAKIAAPYARALYDFSVAINIEKEFQKQGNSNYNPNELAKYFRKCLIYLIF